MNIVSKFWKNVEPEQICTICNAIKEAYYITQCLIEPASFTEEEMPLQRQCIGHVRASMISKKLFAINESHSGIHVELRTNSLGSYTFAQITINKMVILTVKSNDSVSELPEPSDYRKQLAKLNQSFSMPLFDSLPDFNSTFLRNGVNSQISGIVVHKSNSLGSIEQLALIFPCDEYKEIIAEPINLFEMFQGSLGIGFAKSQSNLKSRPPIDIEKLDLKLRTQGDGL